MYCVLPVRPTDKETATGTASTARSRRRGASGGWLVGIIFVAALFGTACHYVNPRCLFLRPYVDRGNEYGLLQVLLQLGTASLALQVDSANVLRFDEPSGGLTTCRRMGPKKNKLLANPWLGPAPGLSEALCGSGYAYVPPRHWPLDDESTCSFSWYGVVQRSYADLPSMSLTYFRPGGSVRLLWDLESRLPEELDEAVTGTLGLLCEESPRLVRSIRKSHPELATRASCLEDGT